MVFIRFLILILFYKYSSKSTKLCISTEYFYVEEKKNIQRRSSGEIKVLKSFTKYSVKQQS